MKISDILNIDIKNKFMKTGGHIMAKVREVPCVSYVCKGETCLKGRKNVEHSGCCQTCKKYYPRKVGNVKKESVMQKKNKAKEKEAKRMMREVY